MASAVLTYKRLVTTYSGEVSYGESRVEFSDIDFSKMMLKVSDFLVNSEAESLSIQRTDRAGLLSIKVEEHLFTLLLEDPLRYIQRHSPPPRTIDLTSKSKRTSALVAGEKTDIPRTSGIRSCTDTLADAFGDIVYVRRRRHRVECPATGRWILLTELEKWLNAPVETCGADSLGWCGIKVDSLLATSSKRFYLPREWNRNHGWIGCDQLRAMLKQFREERVALCQLAETAVPVVQ